MRTWGSGTRRLTTVSLSNVLQTATDPNCLFGTMTLGAGPDYNGDEVVDDTDLDLMMKAYGYKGGRFDMNGDGIVGEKDVAQLVEAWGPVKPLD